MRLDYNSLLAGHYDWTGKAIEALGLILNSWMGSTNYVKIEKRERSKVSSSSTVEVFSPLGIRLKD